MLYQFWKEKKYRKIVSLNEIRLNNLKRFLMLVDTEEFSENSFSILHKTWKKDQQAEEREGIKY